MEYESFRQFADSWGLLYLFVLFTGVILYTFRPGTKGLSDDAAKIPFREDEKNG